MDLSIKEKVPTCLEQKLYDIGNAEEGLLVWDVDVSFLSMGLELVKLRCNVGSKIVLLLILPGVFWRRPFDTSNLAMTIVFDAMHRASFLIKNAGSCY